MVTATSTSFILEVDESQSLPVQKYTVTFTRTSHKQPLCRFFENTLSITINNGSLVTFEGLEEFSLYTVDVRATTFDLTSSLQYLFTITTLSAGGHTGNI